MIRDRLRAALPAATVALAAGCLALPVFGLSGYGYRVLTNVFMAAALAQAMNIMVGFAGYPALGNLVFFGAGGYATAVLTARYGVPFAVALPLAGGIASGYAALLGGPILRLRGAYFGIATIGINEATREIIYNLPLTGGGKGINLPFFPGGVESQQLFFYYAMWGLAALSTLVVLAIHRSRLGFGLRALKADEDAAAVIGVRTTRYKVAAWSISAGLTGLVGSLYAYWISFLEPGPVFDVALSVKYYIIAILGGAGTIVGPLAGALFFELLSEWVWARFLELHLLVLGATVVLVVMFLPRGFAALVRETRKEAVRR